jgi:hypothetical protein
LAQEVGAAQKDIAMFDSTPEPLDLDDFKLSLGFAPAVEFNAEGGLRWGTMWQELEARWKAVLHLEITIDNLRISSKDLLAKMAVLLQRTLPAEEKANYPAADLVQWIKAQTRVHFTLPKLKDFIRRATCATDTPQRTRFHEFFESADGFSTSAREMDHILEELEGMRKRLEVLSTRGWTVCSEGQSVSADLQGALKRLRPAKWQQLEARWKAGLGLEAAIETLRIRLKGVCKEMEASLKTGLTSEEKPNASAADLSEWSKAKSRVHLSLPKAQNFIQRASWATVIPDRRTLTEFFKSADGVFAPNREIDQMLERLEALRRDLQVLSAQGWAISDECKSVTATVQGSLEKLQKNSAARSAQKRRATRARLGLCS